MSISPARKGFHRSEEALAASAVAFLVSRMVGLSRAKRCDRLPLRTAAPSTSTRPSSMRRSATALQRGREQLLFRARLGHALRQYETCSACRTKACIHQRGLLRGELLRDEQRAALPSALSSIRLSELAPLVSPRLPPRHLWRLAARCAAIRAASAFAYRRCVVLLFFSLCRAHYVSSATAAELPARWACVRLRAFVAFLFGHPAACAQPLLARLLLGKRWWTSCGHLSLACPQDHSSRPLCGMGRTGMCLSCADRVHLPCPGCHEEAAQVMAPAEQQPDHHPRNSDVGLPGCPGSGVNPVAASSGLRGSRRHVVGEAAERASPARHPRHGRSASRARHK